MSDWMDAEAHADRAFEMFERGRWAEAEAELRRALALNPDQAEWHFNLGLTLEHAGRPREALACYERTIELMPDEAEPLLAAAALANQHEQFEKAAKWLEQAIRLEPQFEEAYAYKIESHFRMGAHDDAETTFYMAQQALPEPSAQCLAAMAESLIQRQRLDRAEWCLKEAMRLEPHMPRVRARLAAVLAMTGKPQRALQMYLRELRDDPGNIDTLLDYGGLLQDMGRHPEAAEKYRRVLELQPANAEAHYRLGQIAMAAHRFDQASLEFELVLKLQPQFPGIQCAMGEALMRRGLIAEARQFLLDEMATIKSELQPAHQAASDLEAASDQPHKSSEKYNNAVCDEDGGPAGPPTLTLTPPPLAHLADLLLEVDAPSNAAELYALALKTGESPDLLRQLALAKFRAGDRDGGAAVSRRVLRLDPHCVRSMHNLALAALQQNRLAIAHGWIKRGLSINRHDDGLRRLRIRLWLAAVRSTFSRFPRLASHEPIRQLASIVNRLASLVDR